MSSKEAVFPISYLGPISLFGRMANYSKIYLEKKEYFVKQSCRNRCEIIGASGELYLSIPTHRKGRDKRVINQVLISNDEDWKTIHWRSICTAYRSSPYFEYYEADFERIFLDKAESLFDFNFSLFELVLKKLKLNVEVAFTKEFHPSYEMDDFRPMYGRNFKENIEFPRYIQVFEDRVGFHPNLSIIDLLFNEGPSSAEYLKSLAF